MTLLSLYHLSLSLFVVSSLYLFLILSCLCGFLSHFYSFITLSRSIYISSLFLIVSSLLLYHVSLSHTPPISLPVSFLLFHYYLSLSLSCSLISLFLYQISLTFTYLAMHTQINQVIFSLMLFSSHNLSTYLFTPIHTFCLSQNNTLKPFLKHHYCHFFSYLSVPVFPFHKCAKQAVKT